MKLEGGSAPASLSFIQQTSSKRTESKQQQQQQTQKHQTHKHQTPEQLHTPE